MVVESVYTADLKSAARSGLRVRVPPALPNIMRTYVNLEKAQIEQVLAMFDELEEARGLKALEKFLRLVFLDALDKASHGM